MPKLNGAIKWIGVIVVILGMLFRAGWIIKSNSDSIKKFENKQLHTRLTKLETSFISEIKHINTTLQKIEQRMP